MRVFILEDSNSRIVLFREIFADLSIDLTICDDTVTAATKFVGDYNLILLDHDLEHHHQENLEAAVGKKNTGSEFVDYLVMAAHPKQGPVVIHSYNPYSAEYMRSTLEKYDWSVYKQPFGLTLLEKLQEFVTKELAIERNSLDNSPKQA